jgi:hypothetical protein
MAPACLCCAKLWPWCRVSDAPAGGFGRRGHVAAGEDDVGVSFVDGQVAGVGEAGDAVGDVLAGPRPAGGTAVSADAHDLGAVRPVALLRPNGAGKPVTELRHSLAQIPDFAPARDHTRPHWRPQPPNPWRERAVDTVITERRVLAIQKTGAGGTLDQSHRRVCRSQTVSAGTPDRPGRWVSRAPGPTPPRYGTGPRASRVRRARWSARPRVLSPFR